MRDPEGSIILQRVLVLLRHVRRPIGQPPRILAAAGATLESAREANGHSTPYRSN